MLSTPVHRPVRVIVAEVPRLRREDGLTAPPAPRGTSSDHASPAGPQRPMPLVVSALSGRTASNLGHGPALVALPRPDQLPTCRSRAGTVPGRRHHTLPGTRKATHKEWPGQVWGCVARPCGHEYHVRVSGGKRGASQASGAAHLHRLLEDPRQIRGKRSTDDARAHLSCWPTRPWLAIHGSR